MGGAQERRGAPDGRGVRRRDHSRRRRQRAGEVVGDLGAEGASAGQEDAPVQGVDGQGGVVLAEHRRQHRGHRIGDLPGHGCPVQVSGAEGGAAGVGDGAVAQQDHLGEVGAGMLVSCMYGA